MGYYNGKAERDPKEKDTPERIVQLANMKGEFRVSLRYRDDWLRMRCSKLKSEGLLTGGKRHGREIIYYPTASHREGQEHDQKDVCDQYTRKEK